MTRTLLEQVLRKRKKRKNELERGGGSRNFLIFTEYDPVCLCVCPFRVDKEQLVNRKPVHSDLQVETSLFFVGSLCQTWPRYVQPLIGLGLAPCADWLGCVPCADWLGCVPRADWLNFFIAPIGFGLSNMYSR